MAAPGFGTCQLCGAVHRLRGDVLARHHFYRGWRMRSGPCPGAGQLPFERSMQLIDVAIAEASELMHRHERERMEFEQAGNAIQLRNSQFLARWYRRYVEWQRARIVDWQPSQFDEARRADISTVTRAAFY